MAQTTVVHPERQASAAARFWSFILRFQSYFGLIAILILSTLLSPVRDGHNIFLDPTTCSISCALRLKTASSPSA